MRKKNKVIYIVIDHTIRIPEFIANYTVLKRKIFSEEHEKTFWQELAIADPKAFKFYQSVATPVSECEPEFDITYRKYFYNNDHRLKFLEEYSFNLFGAGGVINKQDVTLINIAQSKLIDVILIDRATHTRKITNTFSFLARSGLFVKGVIFVNTDEEIDMLFKEKKCLGIWNPFKDSKMVINKPSNTNEPTEEFLQWFKSIELIKKR